MVIHGIVNRRKNKSKPAGECSPGREHVLRFTDKTAFESVQLDQQWPLNTRRSWLILEQAFNLIL